MSLRRFALAVSLAFLTGSVAHGAARAQDEGADSPRRRFERGRVLAEQGRCAEAYVEFERGYQLSQRPLFLFNMAECARDVGRTDDARRDYQRYLDAEPEGERAAVARERLAELGPAPAAPIAVEAEPSVPAVDLTAPAPATIPAPRSPELWEEWPFWTVLGSVLAVAAVGITLGVVLSGAGGTSCGPPNCAVVEF